MVRDGHGHRGQPDRAVADRSVGADAGEHAAVARDPAAAGSFYPARAEELAADVDALLAAAAPPRVDGVVRALVAPHAGYVYSGAVAAAAFATVGGAGRVALFGPSHFVPLRGVAVSGAEA